MSDLTLTDDARTLMLQGIVAGAAASRLQFLNASDVTLATVVLAIPCGVVDEHTLVLTQEDPEGDLILVTGEATQAKWYTFGNTLLASGAVTDETGDGPFKVAGEDGTTLLAGGRLILGVTALT